MSGGDEQGRSAYPKSIQAGIPKINNPAGWPTPKIGALLKVVQRPVRLEKTKEYRLVTARRSRGGIVRRETLLGKDIATPSQFEIAEGDFLISRRQIAHGACGIVPAELAGSVVSNEYATLRPTAALDPGFLKHLTSSIYFQQTCFHSSIGVHVEKLVFDLQGWLRWPIAVPEPPEQRRIAAVLDTWDNAIEAAEKSAKASAIFMTEKLESVFALLPETQLEDLAHLMMGQSPPSSSYCEPNMVNSLPLAGGAADFDDSGGISAKNWTTEPQKIAEPGAVIMSVRAPVGSVAFNSQRVALGRGVCALRPRYFDCPQLLGYLVLSLDRYWGRIKQGGTFEAVNGEDIRQAPVADVRAGNIELLEKLIVDADTSGRLARKKIYLLRQQKRGLMQKLLTGQLRVPGNIDTLLPAGIEVMP